MFKNLRLLVMLRRIARALESLAESQKELATAAQNRRLERESRAARRPAKTQFGVLDLRESEKLYAKQREAEEFGEEPSDAT
jgi:hypothetical protein